MSIYEEIENNILRINISNHNHHYKYYMRVMEHGTASSIAEYYNLEDFCEFYNIVVLDANNRPMYNNNISFSLYELYYYSEVYENNKNDLIQFVLSKKTNREYLKTIMYGSTQREFVTCYYPEGIDEKILKMVEAYIFDAGDEVFICPWDNVSNGSYYYIAVPNLLDNDFLKFAMSTTGCKEDEIYIECFTKYTVLPRYRHLEFK